MAQFLGTFRDLLKSPLLYLYCAISTTGILAAHFNQGATGNWRLGLTSIISTIAGIAVFYWHLSSIRRGRSLPENRNGLRLFLSVYAFRICLFLALLPVTIPTLIWSYTTSRFDLFTKAYLAITIAATNEEKITALGEAIQVAWPWLLLILTFFILDHAGRSHIVAQESSRKTLRRCLHTLWALKGPICYLIFAQILLLFFNLSDTFSDPFDGANRWVGTIIRLAVNPLQYLLELAATTYMACQIWAHASKLFDK